MVFPAAGGDDAAAGGGVRCFRIAQHASLDPVGGLFTFQPSEMAKPVLVLFLAWFLQTRMHAMDDWKETILPAALMPLVFIALIVKEPDLGTALVCAA